MAGLEKEATRRPRTCTEVFVMKVEQPRPDSPRLQPLASATMAVPEQDMRFLPPGERRWFDDLPRREEHADEESGPVQRESADRRDYRPVSIPEKQSSSGVSYGWLALIAVVLSGIAIWFNWPKDRSKDSGKRGTMSMEDVHEPEPPAKPIEQEVPSVFVTASLNGIPRQATFISGVERSGAMTPLTVNLKNLAGRKWSCKLRYVADGITYEGEGSCMATPGRQALDVKLNPAVPLYDRPTTMNFCRHCRASLSSYLKVPRNCPKCGKNLFGN